MYTTFFGLRELPFPLASDLHFFYSTPTLQKAEADIVTALREHKGLVLVTGESGTGKTMLLRRLASVLATQAWVISLPFSAVTFDDILTYLCSYFSLTPTSDDPFTKVLTIQEHLRSRADQGMGAVVGIDEAQNLHKETLDRLRLLLHLKGPHGRLLQVVLCGHSTLATKLAHPDLRHIQQYVTVHCHLHPLSHEEVHAFIRHRLVVAGCHRRELFSRAAIHRIAEYSQGVPRLINVICDNALLTAYMTDKRLVTPDIVEEVAQNLQLDTVIALTPSEDTQDIVLHEASVVGPTKKVNGDTRGWLYNLAWTGVGLFFAWLSSGSQSFEIPFASLFSSASQPAALSSLSSPPAGPVLPITVSLKNQLEQQRKESRTHLTPSVHEPLPVSATETRHEQTPHSTLVPHKQPVVAPTTAEDTATKIPVASPSERSAVRDQQPHVPPIAVSAPARPPISQSEKATPATSVTTTAHPQKLPVSAPHASSLPHPAPPGTKSQQRNNAPEQSSQARLSLSTGTTEKAQAELKRLGLTPSREALFHAVTTNNQQTLKLLLVARAPMDATDARGWTALMAAARDKQAGLVRMLLAAGADANVTNQEGENALIHAADNGSPAVVQLLLDNGAAINAKSHMGWTALMCAAAKGHRRTVEALLNRGANPKVKDHEGRTASMYAARQTSVASSKHPRRERPATPIRVDRIENDKRELVKRNDYRLIASLLAEAEKR
ncbi:MAG: hypothetical protein FJ147_13395 [Deltaproteobacteria bacterium]|nr:hypothetical protein [Deltaproteobacteria bacterium]